MFPFIVIFGLGYYLYRAATDEAPQGAPATAPRMLTSGDASSRQAPAGASSSVPVEVAVALAYETDVDKLEALAREQDKINPLVSALVRQRIAFLQAMGAESSAPVTYTPGTSPAGRDAAPIEYSAPAGYTGPTGLEPETTFYSGPSDVRDVGEPVFGYSAPAAPIAFSPSGPTIKTTMRSASVMGAVQGSYGARPSWLPAHVAWPPVEFNPQFHNMG